VWRNAVPRDEPLLVVVGHCLFYVRISFAGASRPIARHSRVAAVYLNVSTGQEWKKAVICSLLRIRGHAHFVAILVRKVSKHGKCMHIRRRQMRTLL
jgi:hypothetical protein